MLSKGFFKVRRVNSAGGFTLVELLVVIAIIALLMSILMPALARVRNQAKCAICLSNLRQWGAMFVMYTSANDGHFMPNWSTATRREDYWFEALRPYYMDAGDIRVCPRASKPASEAGGGPFGNMGPFYAWGIFDGDCGEPSKDWDVVTACDYGSYGANGYASDPRTGTASVSDDLYWRTMHVKSGGRIPMFCGDQWLAGMPGEKSAPPAWETQPWNQGSGMVRLCPNRHDGYVNQVFIDCSVRKVGLKELWTLKWHRKFRTNDYWTIAGGVQPSDWPEWMRGFKDY